MTNRVNPLRVPGAWRVSRATVAEEAASLIMPSIAIDRFFEISLNCFVMLYERCPVRRFQIIICLYFLFMFMDLIFGNLD